MLYELPAFEHTDAESIPEAVSWLEKWGSTASVIAGGTDLLGLMKDRLEGPQLKTPQVLVNVKRIARIRLALERDNKRAVLAGQRSRNVTKVTPVRLCR